MPLSTVTLSMGKTGAFANKIAGAFAIAIIHSIVHQMAMVLSRFQTTAVPNRDFQVEHLLFRVVKSQLCPHPPTLGSHNIDSSLIPSPFFWVSSAPSERVWWNAHTCFVRGIASDCWLVFNKFTKGVYYRLAFCCFFVVVIIVPFILQLLALPFRSLKRCAGIKNTVLAGGFNLHHN